jgi:hypothetical protein
MLEVTSDEPPDGHAGGHSVLLTRRHRYIGQLSFYRCWTPGPVPLFRLIAIAVIRWRVEEDHQLVRQSTGLDAGQVIRWNPGTAGPRSACSPPSTSPSPSACNASKTPAQTCTPG